MTLPPLLAIAAGKRTRARKAPQNRPKEIILHMSVANLLRKFARTDWQWTHIANGEIRDKRTAGKLKQMGTRPGWPDFVLVPPSGQLHCLELKRIGETLADSQEEFAAWCAEHGVPHVVAFTLDEALAVFERWGCLRVKLAGGANG
jgi:hypothetical protein